MTSARRRIWWCGGLVCLAYLQTSEVYGRRRTNHTITSFILANHHQSDKHLGWLMCGNLVIGVPESPLCRGRSWCPSTTNQHRRRNSDDDGTEAPRKWSEKHCSALSGSTLFRVEIYKPRFYWYFLGTPWNALCSFFGLSALVDVFTFPQELVPTRGLSLPSAVLDLSLSHVDLT